MFLNSIVPVHLAKRLIMLVAFGCISASLLGCDDVHGPKASDSTIRVAVSPDYPPFEFIHNNEIVGFDIDLAREIAKRMDRVLFVKQLSFSMLIPALYANEADAIISAMSINNDRKKNVEFSDVYYENNMAFLSRDSSPISELTDLNDKKIAVQTGSIMETFLKQYLANHSSANIKLHSLDSNLTAIEELKNNNVEGLIVEEAQAIEFSRANPGLTWSLIKSGGSDGYAVVLAKNSPLANRVNKVLQEMKADGTVKKIRSKWIKEANHQ